MGEILETTLKIIIAIGVPASIAGTWLTAHYSRRNLKATKYIETVSTERIRWLEKVRNDLSQLSSWILIYNSNLEELRELRDEEMELKSELGVGDIYSDVSDPLKERYLVENKDRQNFFQFELKEANRERILEKLYNLKLSISPSESEINEYISDLTEKLTPTLSNFTPSKEIEKTLRILVSTTQELLKREWDKVRHEVTF